MKSLPVLELWKCMPGKTPLQNSSIKPGGKAKDMFKTKDVNRDEQNRRFCWPTSQMILMLGIHIGSRFWDFTCLIWNFLIWKQQNLHIKENDQHLVQLLPNKLVTPFITVLLVSINVFGSNLFWWQQWWSQIVVLDDCRHLAIHQVWFITRLQNGISGCARVFWILCTNFVKITEKNMLDQICKVGDEYESYWQFINLFLPVISGFVSWRFQAAWRPFWANDHVTDCNQ